MTEFLIGPASCGKTTEIFERISNSLQVGRRVILLVPEQAALSTEGELTALLQSRNIPQTDLEVLNFTRLCNRVFRQYGGISYNSVTRGAKALIMWDALFSSAPLLKYYNSIFEDADRFVPSLLSLIDEFKAYNVTPEQLSKAAEEAYTDNTRIADKLTDLSIIYGEYVRLLRTSWDDPSDDLTRLSELLKTESFFCGVDVYIDAFKGFTPQQYNVISHIFRQSDNVAVTLTMNEDPNVYCFDNVRNTLNKLKKLAHNGYKVISFESNVSNKPSDLTLTAQSLWSYRTNEGCLEGDGSVRAVVCDNLYKEIHFIASDIHKKLREGARYRDFAVIARSIDDYKGIIDTVFSRYGLPCRIFDEIQLSETPIFKLVTSAINVRIRDYSLDDIMLYIKTGLTPLTADEIFILERYAFTWNISGSQWTTEEKWFMNPDGYTDELTDEGRHIIDEVNRLKSRIMRPLLRLHEALDGSRTVNEICRSIYDHLVDLEITAKLEADGKDDEVRAFNCLCEALDVMVNAIGSRKMSAKLFLGLFTIVVGQTAIGTLPSTIDEITVGSADLTRATGISHAYVIGVNEECFPKSVSQNSFFSDNDKAYLETCGINLSPSIESDLCDELYYFYKAVAIPSKTLTVTCVLFDKNGAAVRKSVAFNRIAHILGKNMVEESSKISLNNTVFTTESGLHALCGDETEETAAIRRALSTDSDAASLLNAQTQSFYSDADAEGISEEVMKIIYPGDMKLSQSKLDKIALCPMSYQLSYALRLKEEKRATFQANDSGILVHRIVEVFFRNVSTEDGVKSLTDEEIDEMIDDILNDYLASIFGNKTLENVSKRAMNLFKRLKRTSKVVIKNLLEEFSQSDFVPRFFELPIEASDEAATVKSIDFKLFDGTKASLIGTVDRVDVCQKNNKLYVRVVDYKTGNKTFDLADVAQGFNLQMLLYLFSIWKDGNGKFKKSLNFDGDIIPAGVLYLIAKTPSLEEEPSTDPATIYRLAAEKITRNGLLIKDEDILRMMEKKLEGKYIPIKEASDNAMKNRKKLADSLGIVNTEIFSDSSLKSLATLEEMGALLNQITDTVTKLANEIKSGNASCSPIRNDKHDSCKYCPHKAICRNPKSFEKISKY